MDRRTTDRMHIGEHNTPIIIGQANRAPRREFERLKRQVLTIIVMVLAVRQGVHSLELVCSSMTACYGCEFEVAAHNSAERLLDDSYMSSM